MVLVQYKRGYPPNIFLMSVDHIDREGPDETVDLQDDLTLHILYT